MREVTENGVPCEGFAAKCGGKTDAVNRFGGVEATEFGQGGEEIDALYDCLIVVAARFNMIGPRDNQWFAGAAFVGICLSASQGRVARDGDIDIIGMDVFFRAPVYSAIVGKEDHDGIV